MYSTCTTELQRDFIINQHLFGLQVILNGSLHNKVSREPQVDK